MDSLRYRPMACAGFAALIIMFSVIASGFIFGGGLVCLAVGAVLTAVLIITREFSKHHFLVYVCSALIFSGVLLTVTAHFDIDASLALTGEGRYVTAVVTDDTASYSSSEEHTLKIKSIDGKRLDTKLALYSKSSFPFEPGDVISFRTKLSDNISSKSFTGKMPALSAEKYLYTYLADTDGIVLEKDGAKTVQHLLYLIRNAVKSRIHSFLPGEEGAVTSAMLLGDKSGVDSSVMNSFRKTGISHLFAVSGLHLSVFAMSIYLLLKKLIKKNMLPEILCLGFIIMFMALTGFTASVCRAGIMLIIVLAAVLFDEDNDPLNSLGLAVLIILFVNPVSAVSVSLLLSFCAAWGIITAFPFFKKRIDYLLFTVRNYRVKSFFRAVLSAAAVSFCASVFTLPVTALFIGNVSTVSPVTNIFVSFAATVQMVSGGLSAVFFPLKFLALPCAFACGLISKYVIFVSDFIARVPFCSFEADSFYFRAALMLAVSGIICAAVICENPKKRIVSFVCVVLSVSIGAFAVYYINEKDNVRVTAFNTGGGTAVLVEHLGSSMLLGCGGSGSYPEESLVSTAGYSPDLLLIPDNSRENSSMSVYFTDSCRPRTVICGEKNHTVGLLRNDYRVNSRFIYRPWSGAALEFIKNADGSYAMLDCGKEKILIVFSCENENLIPEKYLDSDILITSEDIKASTADFGSVIISSTADNTEKICSRIDNKNIYSLCRSDRIEAVIGGEKEKILCVQR